jgi:putative colanic acid biosysnthesis UDP-glucose lipid carrier transferase
MVALQRGRYSKYLRFISASIDVGILMICNLWLSSEWLVNFLVFIGYQLASWLILSLLLGFYAIYRFTTPVEILTKIIKQWLLFGLLLIAFFPLSQSTDFDLSELNMLILSMFVLSSTAKFLLFYYLKRYRIETGNNKRKAIIVGYTPESKNLKSLFEKRVDYGYEFFGFFSDKKTNAEIAGKIIDIPDFVFENKIDELYCSLQELSNEQMKYLHDFAERQGLIIKFIPDSKQIFTKNLRIDYYEIFPVLSIQKTPLNDPLTKTFKRVFDVVFSLFVILFILSWMVPIFAIIIRLESKGPIFFKQGRPGLNEEEFFCFKFRSMKMNVNTETEASKNDPRVTRVGRFMRKTSIDELPQFFNVLRGEMSVVGPRPHLWSQNTKYATKIQKYMVRLYVKPGITGLAQVKGYRGEIETDTDMINRIKYDVFYIENWSFFLDLKIIVMTVFNIFKGEEKAY